MPLMWKDASNLLWTTSGLAWAPACCCCKEGCADCLCCICHECGDGKEYALPTSGCHNSTGKYCLTVTLAGLTFVTSCRTYRDTSCTASPGTYASYKLLASSLPSDLVLPFNWNDSSHTPIRDPDSPCSNISNVCQQWRMCVTLPDTGIDFTQYANSNCTGASNTASVLVAQAVLDYQVVGTTRRFVLWVTVAVGSAIPIPIFFGVRSFDARQCANYSAWPLTVNNAIASTNCLCGGSGTAIHPLATGGTATLALACDNPNCDGSESAMGGGESLVSMDALRTDDQGAAAAVTKAKKRCCF